MAGRVLGRRWPLRPRIRTLWEMARVMEWNGKDVPEELRKLPAGRYLLQPVEEAAPALTEAEEEGIRQALRSLERGEGRDLEKR